MAHTRGCAEAKQHRCECSGCGGSEHGWSGRLALARAPEQERAAARTRVDQAWAKAGRRKARTPSRGKQAAATDSAVIDIVDWLADHPDAINDVQEMGDALARSVIGELDRSLDPALRPGRMKAMTDHFWCDLLAACSCGIDRFRRQLDQVPAWATTAIPDSRDPASRDTTKPRSVVEDTVVGLAVRVTWSAIKKLSFFDQIDHLLQVTRILGILICKAPEDHRAVARCCLKPLTGGVISEQTKERLMEIFPPDWLGQIQRSLSA